MPDTKRDVAKIIEQLKMVRLEKGITYQKIVDETEKNGEAVSLATVKRVFSDNSENEFRWATTIKPIAAVVLGLGKEEGFNPADGKSYYDEIVALRDIIALKNDMLQDAQKKVDHLKAEVEYMRAQMQAKDEQIKNCSVLIATRGQFMKNKDRTITILSVLLFICVVIIIWALAIDAMNPDVGFFWHALHR